MFVSFTVIFTFEVLAALFKFFWVLFKDAVVGSTTAMAFNILEKALKGTTRFLQSIGFFDVLKDKGGWVSW